MFLVFILILGGILYYRRKGKMTEAEKKMRRKKEEMYITEKLKSLKGDKNKDQNLIITDLPKLSSGFDVLQKNYYAV